MRINPITNVSYTTNRNYIKKIQQTTQEPIGQPVEKPIEQPTFKSKYGFTKGLAGIFGTIGTLGAIGGTVIMTGGIALPFVLGYGAACTASGAAVGYVIDTAGEDAKKDK